MNDLVADILINLKNEFILFRTVWCLKKSKKSIVEVTVGTLFY